MSAIPDLHSRTPNGTIDEAISANRQAQDSWRRTTLSERSAHVRRIRERIAATQDSLVEVISRETHRPATDVLLQEVTATLGMLKYLEKRYPAWLSDESFREYKPGFWSKSNRVCYDAIGVVAVIGPATFPFSLVTMQTCAALMCGNTVVLKPSERCPEVASCLNTLFTGSGLPPDVVRIIEGGSDVVESIISSPDTDKILFTGSSESGRNVADLCGRHFKPCVLELGGDGPAIVCDDADMDLAAKALLWSALYANGQACIGTRQVLGLPGISKRLIERMIAEEGKLQEGSPNRADTDVPNGFRLHIAGSIAAKTKTIVSNPARSGAGRVEDERATEGPVLEFIDVASLDEAIDLINGSPSGLSASVWSRNTKHAQRIARRLKVGMVCINDASIALPDFPWGGVRSSGWGRLFSRQAIPELTQLKTISTDKRYSARPKIWWFPYSKQKYELVKAANTFLFGRRNWDAFAAVFKAAWTYLRS